MFTNIQNKPYAYRIKILWTAVLICLLALIALWLITNQLQKKRPKANTILENIGSNLKESREYWDEVAPRKTDNKQETK